jgi:N-acylglucosamine-6-phosphate 2-epimerase
VTGPEWRSWHDSIASLRGGVVVSCQAASGSPLDTPSFIAALAQSAARGGAVGFRVNGPANTAAVRAITDLPIIGIHKVRRPDGGVVITPTLDDALSVVDAGASIVALDSTEDRHDDQALAGIVDALHARGIGVMADIATAAEAREATAAGVDLVATTLAGYTPATSHLDPGAPAFGLLRELRDLAAPVVVEGRIWTTEHVTRCFDGGAYAVVIGSAITAPELITRRFVAAALGQR